MISQNHRMILGMENVDGRDSKTLKGIEENSLDRGGKIYLVGFGSRYSHFAWSRTQTPHFGRSSSHLTLRFRQVSQAFQKSH